MSPRREFRGLSCWVSDAVVRRANALRVAALTTLRGLLVSAALAARDALAPLRGAPRAGANRLGGDVAQLGERLVRNEEVVGSIPIISTKFFEYRGPGPAQPGLVNPVRTGR